MPLEGTENPYRTRVRSVRAVDPKTVRVVLSSRWAFWRDLFEVVLPEHALRGADLASIWMDRIDDPRTGRPIASGPFLVQRWERGKRLTLVRNPRYWGQHRAYLNRIDVRYSFEPAVIGDLFRQGADVGQWQYSEDLVAALRRMPDLELAFAADTHWLRALRPTHRPRWPSGAQRQARAPRSRVRDRPGGPRSGRVRRDRRRASPAGQHTPPSGHRSYKPNWATYRYRPVEARRLLEQAGCRRER